jgi:hypothetical protein
MFYSLEGLTALASYLLWGVFGEETLGVLPGEGVPCDDAVKG